MKEVERVLSAFVGPDVGAMGGRRPEAAPPQRTLSKRERAALKQALARVARSNQALVVLAAGMLGALFCVSSGLGLAYHEHAAAVVGAFAGWATLSTWCVVWIVRLWQTKTAMEQLLALAIALEGEALAATIDALYQAARDGRVVRSEIKRLTGHSSEAASP